MANDPLNCCGGSSLRMSLGRHSAERGWRGRMAPLALIHLINLLFLASLSTAGRGSKDSFSRVLKIEEFTQCPKNSLNTIENISVALTGRGKYAVNVVFRVTETITGGKFWITMNKCLSTSADDCEYVMSYYFDFCKMLETPGPWIGFLEQSEPQYKCPMKPANYTIKNGAFDAAQVMNVGSKAPSRWWDSYHWRFKFELIDKKQSLGCGFMTISYQRIRST